MITCIPNTNRKRYYQINLIKSTDMIILKKCSLNTIRVDYLRLAMKRYYNLKKINYINFTKHSEIFTKHSEIFTRFLLFLEI